MNNNTSLERVQCYPSSYPQRRLLLADFCAALEFQVGLRSESLLYDLLSNANAYMTYDAGVYYLYRNSGKCIARIIPFPDGSLYGAHPHNPHQFCWGSFSLYDVTDLFLNKL